MNHAKMRHLTAGSGTPRKTDQSSRRENHAKKIIGAVILIIGITLTVTGAYMIDKCDGNIMAVGPFVAYASFNR